MFICVCGNDAGSHHYILYNLMMAYMDLKMYIKSIIYVYDI